MCLDCRSPKVLSTFLNKSSGGVSQLHLISGAGLRPGDLVLTLDDKPMENGRQFHVGLYRRLPGDVVTLEVLRDAERLRIPVEMAERARTSW